MQRYSFFRFIDTMHIDLHKNSPEKKNFAKIIDRLNRIDQKSFETGDILITRKEKEAFDRGERSLEHFEIITISKEIQQKELTKTSYVQMLRVLSLLTSGKKEKILKAIDIINQKNKKTSALLLSYLPIDSQGIPYDGNFQGITFTKEFYYYLAIHLLTYNLDYLKKCNYCKRFFVGQMKKQKTCSEKCAKLAYENTQERKRKKLEWQRKKKKKNNKK